MLKNISMKKVKKVELKVDVVSNAIAQIIDHLSYQYQMRFTLVSTVQRRWSEDLACKIMKLSNSTVNFKYIDIEDESQLIDFDESYVVFHEQKAKSVFSERMTVTKYATYRRTMVLLFNPDYLGSSIEEMDEHKIIPKIYNTVTISHLIPDELAHPHDIYQLSHDIRNGSMWLMGNELFFNGSCESHYHPMNFFNSSELKWNSMTFFNEYKSFNNCEILMETFFEDSDLMNMHIKQSELFRKKSKYVNLTIEAFARKHQIAFTEDFFDRGGGRDNFDGDIFRRRKTHGYNNLTEEQLQIMVYPYM